MKHFLLPPTGRFYKANLHCHTTFSDGAKTPEEVKQLYLEHGYSIVAYTDHDVLIAHPELNDENFLALNGFEAEVSGEVEPNIKTCRTCHLCFIAKNPKNLTMPFYHREKYLFENAKNYRHLLQFDQNEPDYEREYTPECINDMISRGKQNGFFVTYNHPVWSLEDFSNYMAYEGMDAMEVYNHSSGVIGFPEFNAVIYDQMLRGGKRLYCIAADDNHNRSPENSNTWDSFGGFVMIKAEELSYEAVISALEKGHFYASLGPHIHSLSLEDSVLTVTCSGAAKIALSTGRRRAEAVYCRDGELLESASFRLHPNDIYVRLTVVDPRGNEAYTNAYFLEDMPPIEPIVKK